MQLIVFLAVLSILIVVHELGHFLAAKRFGILVEKFSIGFGPVLLRRVFGKTEFCLSLLPLGGFVKMAGDTPEEVKGKEWEFCSKSPRVKAMVVMAGPLMNAMLAVCLFTIIAFAGQPTPTTRVGRVMDGMPAKAAGLLPGDKILSVNDASVETWEELLACVRKSPSPMSLQIERNKAPLRVMLIPKIQTVNNFFGGHGKISLIGVVPSAEVTYVRHGVLESLRVGVTRVFQMTAMLLTSLWMVVCGAIPAKESLAGPIGIFYMTSEAASRGLLTLLNFMGALSVSLFVLNLLPVPVLDGGHLLFLMIEKIKGSPLSDRFKERTTQVGMVLLLALMVFLVAQDLKRFAFFGSRAPVSVAATNQGS